VAATLGLSLDEIRRSNALAADDLFLAACVDRKDIPLDLLDASSTRAREGAVKVLSRYVLVTRRPAESALDLHGLVHRALTYRVGSADEPVQPMSHLLLVNNVKTLKLEVLYLHEHNIE
jgi:hypothetical protein